MKSVKAALTLAIAVLAIAASGSALAFGHGGHGGGHVRFGVFVGAPLFFPGYYPYYPSYYPAPYYYPPVAMQSAPQPQVYIEQSAPQAAPAQANYWYFCAGAKAYYPYVRECPGGWQRVAPQPQ